MFSISDACTRNKILHFTYRDHITNEEVLLRTGSRKLADTVAEHRFHMAGHILRLPSLDGCNVTDSRRWQAKKRTPKEDTAQNNPGSHDESQHLMGRG